MITSQAVSIENGFCSCRGELPRVVPISPLVSLPPFPLLWAIWTYVVFARSHPFHSRLWASKCACTCRPTAGASMEISALLLTRLRSYRHGIGSSADQLSLLTRLCPRISCASRLHLVPRSMVSVGGCGCGCYCADFHSPRYW